MKSLPDYVPPCPVASDPEGIYYVNAIFSRAETAYEARFATLADAYEARDWCHELGSDIVMVLESSPSLPRWLWVER